jgi:DNA-binding NarL/FixJ family response regulator
MPERTAVDRPSLLLAGLSQPLSADGNGFVWTAADDAREVLLRLRATPVDLMLLGPAIGDTSFESLMRRVKTVRPAQKWALVAPDVEPEREIEARSLGVLAVFDGPPSAFQLREILGRLQPRMVLSPGVGTLNPRRPRPPGRQRAPASPAD